MYIHIYNAVNFSLVRFNLMALNGVVRDQLHNPALLRPGKDLRYSRSNSTKSLVLGVGNVRELGRCHSLGDCA